jgi:hypothetical protein
MVRKSAFLGFYRFNCRILSAAILCKIALFWARNEVAN